MIRFSLDEQTRRVETEAGEYWENMGQGMVLPFVTFPVVEGRIGHAWVRSINMVTGEEMVIEVGLPELPPHWVAKGDAREPTRARMPQKRGRWLRVIFGGLGLLFLLWLRNSL